MFKPALSRIAVAACAMVALAVGYTPSDASAGMIVGFETAPLGAATHGQALSGAYELDDATVEFGFDRNRDRVIDTAAYFERVGRPLRKQWGFVTGPGSGQQTDTELHPHEGQLGEFFLRHRKTGKKPPVFLANIASESVVDSVRGEIWDINGSRAGTERWRVSAYDAAGAMLASLLSPVGKTRDGDLDGRPWTFEFTDLDGIALVEIEFVGSKKKRIGYAFDNFVFGVAAGPEVETNPDPEPEPEEPPVCPPPPVAAPTPTAAAGMILLAAAGLARRRNRNRA